MWHTRIAPSPTGDMHIGTLRTAYFNWLIAKSTGGIFYLRIDDTDQKRHDEQKVKDIFEIMEWAGLIPDKCVRQSERLANYKAHAENLVLKGFAEFTEGGAIKLRWDRKINPFDLVWYDTILGPVKVSEEIYKDIDGLILIKSDGYPTYHMASVVDDIEFKVNWVVRGADHILNTSKQAALFSAINHNIPLFTHVGLIHKDKKKLSKRDGAASVLYLKERGYDPDAVLNFLLRLGWGPTKDDKSTTIIDKERAIKMFLTEGKMRLPAANFDQDKLDSFDRKYKVTKKNITGYLS
jgi:glutamyl/glutaminyl-tRNA synthetase